MKILIQRVKESSVQVDGKLVSEIGKGMLILVGITVDDTESDIDLLARKAAAMRIFPDKEGIMNLSVKDIGGEVLIVSQFTLCANIKKGNRPSYIEAAKAEKSEPFYLRFCQAMEHEIGKPVKRGIFGADMKVELINDGPVTIWADSKAL